MGMSRWDSCTFSHSLGDLGARFSQRVDPTPIDNPTLSLWNEALAADIGLPADIHTDASTAMLLGGSALPESTHTRASVYAGHQFGVFAGQLGDGRALLLGELNGYELQLKGAGPTPYSRRADGRAVLRSSIREYLCSEAMHAMGIPTTRALALVSSPEIVWRERAETAAVVTRVAPTFLRFGHFEMQYYRRDHDALKALADYAIARWFPACLNAANPYQAMLDEVISRTAQLIAQWQAVGFCHGVMNSDNMSLIGLTIDYGPFGFLDHFDAGHICNHSDHQGRYRWEGQPEAGLFNLHCLAQALLPLLDRDVTLAALQSFQPQFEAAMMAQFRRKLGLMLEEDSDWPLLIDLLNLMQTSRTDWTIFWRVLSHEGVAGVRDMFIDRVAFDVWADRYESRLVIESVPASTRQTAMLAANPAYVLRNWMAEEAIQAAEQGDFSVAKQIELLLRTPFTEQAGMARFAALPPDWAKEISVSCSS
ncbi:YdiU family protein [Burkholderiaceae bacterium DAT-1]|nr:YdiU family protein [Burkholderiaceae bacterium DAT-1]